MPLSKKLLWPLLTLIICFDNIYSYVAIAFQGRQEAHPIARFFASFNPFAYFVGIPVTLFLFWLVAKIGGWLGSRSPQGINAQKKEIYERIILTEILIAWGIGNTFWNVNYFLLGRFPFSINWKTMWLIGLSLAIAYGLYSDWKVSKFL